MIVKVEETRALFVFSSPSEAMAAQAVAQALSFHSNVQTLLLDRLSEGDEMYVVAICNSDLVPILDLEKWAEELMDAYAAERHPVTTDDSNESGQ